MSTSKRKEGRDMEPTGGKINITRIRKLADTLEPMPAVYDSPQHGLVPANADALSMAEWCLRLDDCGTVGCIAGHTLALFGDDAERAVLRDMAENGGDASWGWPVAEHAAKLLGVMGLPYRHLFYRRNVSTTARDSTDGAQAAQVLRYIADTAEAAEASGVQPTTYDWEEGILDAWRNTP